MSSDVVHQEQDHDRGPGRRRAVDGLQGHRRRRRPQPDRAALLAAGEVRRRARPRGHPAERRLGGPARRRVHRPDGRGGQVPARSVASSSRPTRSPGSGERSWTACARPTGCRARCARRCAAWTAPGSRCSTGWAAPRTTARSPRRWASRSPPCRRCTARPPTPVSATWTRPRRGEQSLPGAVDIDTEAAEVRTALVGAIRQLPERDQVLMTLYYFEGLTLSEIGQVLKVTESRISQLHSRCTAALAPTCWTTRPDRPASRLRAAVYQTPGSAPPSIERPSRGGRLTTREESHHGCDDTPRTARSLPRTCWRGSPPEGPPPSVTPPWQRSPPRRRCAPSARSWAGSGSTPVTTSSTASPVSSSQQCDARPSTTTSIRAGRSCPASGSAVRHDGPSADPAVNDAFDGTAATYDFLHEVFGRDSLDGKGMELVSTVHYGVDFDNAFWNGAQMVYGDGSGELFIKGALTAAKEIVAHELFHGVTTFTADLDLQQAVRSAQRALLRRVRLTRQAAPPRPDRGGGRLADRRRDAGALAGPGAAVDEGAGHGVRRRPAAGAHGRLRRAAGRQRPAQRQWWRAHQLRDPQPRLLPARHQPGWPGLGHGGSHLVPHPHGAARRPTPSSSTRPRRPCRWPRRCSVPPSSRRWRTPGDRWACFREGVRRPRRRHRRHHDPHHSWSAMPCPRTRRTP